MNRVKGYGLGYVISTISVLLLGAVAWKTAAEDPWLMAALILGMLLSVVGMVIRWRAHDKEKKQQRLREELRAPHAPGTATPLQAQRGE
jgi:hypothetical protein